MLLDANAARTARHRELVNSGLSRFLIACLSSESRDLMAALKRLTAERTS